jgi:hypothetical protein
MAGTGRGVIYGGSRDAPVWQRAWTVDNCFATVFFTDIDRLEDVWNVTVETTR